VAFSPDGRHVLSGGGGALEDHVEFWTGDYALRLWRVPDPIAPVSEEAGGSSQVPGRTATTVSAIKGRSYQHQGATKTTIAVPPGTLLTDAIRQFNQRQKQHPIGGEQPPLTDDEVVASIRYTDDYDECPALSNKHFRQFREIAEKRCLAGGWQFEAVTELEGVD
jgi:hypothetical protein